jgi:hypothetical protein
VEEIAPTDEVAVSQAASLATLVTMARGFTQPLSANPANKALKQMLESATVTPRHNRVIVTATVAPSLLATLVEENSSYGAETQSPPAPSK